MALAISFRLPAAVREDEAARCFVSYCPPLDLYSAGTTKEKAKEALISAIELFVLHCFKRKILDDFMVSRGLFPARDGSRDDDSSARYFIELTEFGGQQYPVSVSMPLLAAQAKHAAS